MKRVVAAAIVTASAVADARDVHVTAVTPSTIYIDAGTSDGLAVGTSWQATVDGRALGVRVAAVASHDAQLEVDGPRPAVGSMLALPNGLMPPATVAPRPAPIAMPPWSEPPAVLGDVQKIASREQPVSAAETAETVVSGELALSAFLAADTSAGSTSSQDLSLSSQLAIESGAWRYDHLIDAHIAATPELFTSPLQHAQARFDVYLMRIAYAPSGARYATALGRQPAAPIGELGTIDGGKLGLSIDRRFDVTVFAGLRPGSDLGLSAAPRAGADLGWQLVTPTGTRARADAGLAIDEYSGHLDRALAAVSASLSTPRDLLHAESTLDLASDANGKGARLSRLLAFARSRRGRITASLQLGYDRPFWDRALAAEEPDLLLGPRSFAEAEASYELRTAFDIGASTRVSTGDGFTSTYADVTGAWHDASHVWLVTAAPFLVAGRLVDQYGVRGSLNRPLGEWSLGVSGSFDRVYAAGESAWSGLGRISGSRPLYHRWRTALSFEIAAGDGPVRLLAFGLLAYLFGK
ncbi:MAG: hypothetical protein JO257_10220 [Deltaproteobacteria bacterium]|nr:hypothetical protein [Deltaproteobacteria bacterium]